MKYLLCHYMKECYHNKWIAPVDGNISFKPKNADYFYITPASLRKQEINNEDIVKINIAFQKSEIENNNEKINDLEIKKAMNKFYPFISLDRESQRQPSGELPLHTFFMLSPFYKEKDLCVVHCHPPYILAYVGLVNHNRELKSILSLFPELSVRIGNNVPYITAKTDKLGKKTYENMLRNRKDMNDYPFYQIVALKQHGVVCVEENFQKVMEIIETLEYYCKIALLAQEPAQVYSNVSSQVNF